MKKLSQYFSVVLLLVALFSSCDKISKPYRVDPGNQNTSFCDTPAFPALTVANALQKYLLEDFTGHTCVNCPNGHRKAAVIKGKMGDTLIVLSIHAGTNSEPSGMIESCLFDTDFRTEMGLAIFKEFNPQAVNPRGMINRLKFGGNVILPVDNWENAMESVPRQAPKIGMQLVAQYNVEHEAVCIFVKTTIFDAIPQNARLILAVAEDSIIAPQKDGFAVICDYVHRHVLREGVTSWEGIPLNISAAGDTTIHAFSVELKGKNWARENCLFLAYIVDPTTQEILQVEEVGLSN